MLVLQPIFILFALVLVSVESIPYVTKTGTSYTLPATPLPLGRHAPSIPQNAPKIGFENMPFEIKHHIFKFLDQKSLSQLDQTSKRNHQIVQPVLNNHLTALLLKTPILYNKNCTIELLPWFMKIAIKRRIRDVNQRMWIVEGALVSDQAQDIEIVKQKVELIPAMQNICIRLIRDRKQPSQVKARAAEFMLFLGEKGIIKNQRNDISADFIIKQYQTVNRDLSEKLVHSKDLNEITSLVANPDVDLNYKDQFGNSVLSKADCDLAMLELLLKQPGIDLNHQDFMGCTALTNAANLGCAPVVKLLLQQPGIDVNHATKDGYTALTYASMKGRVDMVKVLLEQHNINVYDGTGDAAWQWAARRGHSDLIELFRSVKRKSNE